MGSTEWFSCGATIRLGYAWIGNLFKTLELIIKLIFQPVEYEIDKANGIKGPSDVHEMGIDVYNNKCREIVMRYAKEWQHSIERMGRWIDFKNDYKTMYPEFMESVWWVFSQLFKKDLVYRGVKVMPFSTGCSTPLSNFEAGQNYKDVMDPAG
jgi:isoleucyl-tRNA synthetase